MYLATLDHQCSQEPGFYQITGTIARNVVVVLVEALTGVEPIEYNA
jgi:hypothetical protein